MARHKEGRSDFPWSLEDELGTWQRLSANRDYRRVWMWRFSKAPTECLDTIKGGFRVLHLPPVYQGLSTFALLSESSFRQPIGYSAENEIPQFYSCCQLCVLRRVVPPSDWYLASPGIVKGYDQPATLSFLDLGGRIHSSVPLPARVNGNLVAAAWTFLGREFIMVASDFQVRVFDSTGVLRHVFDLRNAEDRTPSFRGNATELLENYFDEGRSESAAADYSAKFESEVFTPGSCSAPQCRGLSEGWTGTAQILAAEVHPMFGIFFVVFSKRASTLDVIWCRSFESAQLCLLGRISFLPADIIVIEPDASPQSVQCLAAVTFSSEASPCFRITQRNVPRLAIFSTTGDVALLKIEHGDDPRMEQRPIDSAGKVPPVEGCEFSFFAGLVRPRSDLEVLPSPSHSFVVVGSNGDYQIFPTAALLSARPCCGGSEAVSCIEVKAPVTSVASRVSWAGDHSLALLAKQPRPSGAAGHLLLVGGPGGNWLPLACPRAPNQDDIGIILISSHEGALVVDVRSGVTLVQRVPPSVQEIGSVRSGPAAELWFSFRESQRAKRDERNLDYARVELMQLERLIEAIATLVSAANQEPQVAIIRDFIAAARFGLKVAKSRGARGSAFRALHDSWTQTRIDYCVAHLDRLDGWHLNDDAPFAGILSLGDIRRRGRETLAAALSTTASFPAAITVFALYKFKTVDAGLLRLAIGVRFSLGLLSSSANLRMNDEELASLISSALGVLDSSGRGYAALVCFPGYSACLSSAFSALIQAALETGRPSLTRHFMLWNAQAASKISAVLGTNRPAEAEALVAACDDQRGPYFLMFVWEAVASSVWNCSRTEGDVELLQGILRKAMSSLCKSWEGQPGPWKGGLMPPESLLSDSLIRFCRLHGFPELAGKLLMPCHRVAAAWAYLESVSTTQRKGNPSILESFPVGFSPANVNAIEKLNADMVNDVRLNYDIRKKRLMTVLKKSQVEERRCIGFHPVPLNSVYIRFPQSQDKEAESWASKLTNLTASRGPATSQACQYSPAIQQHQEVAEKTATTCRRISSDLHEVDYRFPHWHHEERPHISSKDAVDLYEAVVLNMVGSFSASFEASLLTTQRHFENENESFAFLRGATLASTARARVAQLQEEGLATLKKKLVSVSNADTTNRTTTDEDNGILGSIVGHIWDPISKEGSSIYPSMNSSLYLNCGKNTDAISTLDMVLGFSGTVSMARHYKSDTAGLEKCIRRTLQSDGSALIDLITRGSMAKRSAAPMATWFLLGLYDCLRSIIKPKDLPIGSPHISNLPPEIYMKWPGESV